jgi:hypothetical protein
MPRLRLLADTGNYRLPSDYLSVVGASAISEGGGKMKKIAAHQPRKRRENFNCVKTLPNFLVSSTRWGPQ